MLKTAILNDSTIFKTTNMYVIILCVSKFQYNNANRYRYIYLFIENGRSASGLTDLFYSL